ncbi:hypothetical protein DB345_10200 [Spartobacteria bacterium LR76]|nr:hypothetical protein DB345_10200 [Spartobacteria bacterium LR76]
MKLLLASILLCAAAMTRLAADDIALSTFNDNPKANPTKIGLHMETALGSITMELPQLIIQGKPASEREKPEITSSTETEVSVSFKSGATFRYEVSAPGEVTCTYGNLPADAAGLFFSMFIRTEFVLGGRYAFGNQTPKTFPDISGSPNLVDGAKGVFVFAAPTGDAVSLDMPADWQGLVDYRNGGMNGFSFKSKVLFKTPPVAGSFQIKIQPTTMTL